MSNVAHMERDPFGPNPKGYATETQLASVQTLIESQLDRVWQELVEKIKIVSAEVTKMHNAKMLEPLARELSAPPLELIRERIRALTWRDATLMSEALGIEGKKLLDWADGPPQPTTEVKS